ncbi:MAG TPA: hypothetical protein VGE28_13120 [Pseudomonas sp.]
MKKLTALPLALALTSSLAGAGEILDSDTGTYVLLGRDSAPTEVFYRLSKQDGEWVMHGKQAGSTWTNISCDSGCDYRKTTHDEITAYFPADWVANTDIACIQNIAQAFCRFTAKTDPGKTGHVLIALVTGTPIPMFLQRTSAQGG